MRKIKEFFNEEGKFNVKDILVLGIIVIFYSILSFINLGSTTNPNTFYEIDNKNGIVIELKDKTDLALIKFYNGELAGDYYIGFSDDGKKFTNEAIMRGHNAFAWDYGKLNTSTKYIKLVPKNDKILVLGEIALYDNGGNKVTVRITSDGEKIYKLSDEASTVPNKVSNLNSTYFDEIYYARSSYDYLTHSRVFDWVHPPLGKMIMSLPVIITGTLSPFNYRLMGNIAGILMIIVMYSFGKMMFRKRKYATLAALLMTFDTLHFTMTRIGTVESFLTLFTLLTFFYMFKYFKEEKRRYLLFTGIFLGLAISVKWTALFSMIGLLIMYAYYCRYREKNVFMSILKYIGVFLVIPLILYFSFYFIYPKNGNMTTNSISTIVEQNKDMLNYHTSLNETHSYASKWYSWPISYRPVWLYSSSVNSTIYDSQTIVAIGNVLIWWPAIMCFFLLPYYSVKKRNKKSMFLLLTILTLYLPFAFVNRILFLYDYFFILPFIMLGIVNFFYQANKNSKKDILIGLYILLVMIAFFIYYPVISGKNTTNNYINSTKLLSSWDY